MKCRQYSVLVFALAAVVIMLLPSGAKAATLTYAATSPGLKQPIDGPCVIGDPSCDNSVSAAFRLDYTVNSGPCNQTVGDTCDFWSPIYVAGASIDPPLTIPLNFSVGVDDNRDGTTPELLLFFRLYSCTSATGDAAASCANIVDQTTTTYNLNYTSGTGETDGQITGFSTLTPGNHYAFRASWSADSDGQEQFWLQPGPPIRTPEPATFTMLGAGLLGLVGLARRRLTA